jgi:hypothetical protein
MLRRLGYGAVLWVIPYATAIPLLALNHSNPALFQTIMIVVGSLVGGFLSAHYFLAVEHDYLKEGLVLALTWIAVNWLLDVVALLSFTGQSIPRYLQEIGLRYLAIAAPTVAIGFVLQRKLAVSQAQMARKA